MWEWIHRINAIVLAVFIVVHLGVHATAIISPEQHASSLAWMKQYYAHPRMEFLLLVSVFIQIVSGFMELKLVVHSVWRLIRNLTGLYLLVFMAIHVISVLLTRHVAAMPTDFYWIAGAFQVEPLAPYAQAFYGLAVFSVFGHLLAALAAEWKTMPAWLHMIGWSMALATSLSIIMAFSGLFYFIDIPPEVEAGYEAWIEDLSAWVDQLLLG